MSQKAAFFTGSVVGIALSIIPLVGVKEPQIRKEDKEPDQQEDLLPRDRNDSVSSITSVQARTEMTENEFKNLNLWGKIKVLTKKLRNACQ